MYKISWDIETGGIKLDTKITDGTLGILPRPVFFEELDLLGLSENGWIYPHCEEPIMWAINKQYYYRGQRIFEAKNADLETKPTLEFVDGLKPQTLDPIDIQEMLDRNSDLMFVLENEAIEFIRDVFSTYTKVNKTYNKALTNQLDFDALSKKVEIAKREKMAVIKQDCDSFDIVPLTKAQKDGQRVLLSTRIDYFIASFSGGKDSQVLLDLCTRAIPPTDFEVMYSDTGYELPTSLSLFEEVKSYYHERFPSLKFIKTKNHESVLKYWDLMGTPSDTHRWCCSVMKTAPLYKMLKIEGNRQAKVLTFDGVRAEESTKRENYQRIGKGKHTNVYNAHPILRWNSVETFLYIFRHNLPFNPAYRFGKARVGCLVCPFSTAWDDMISNQIFPKSLSPFIGKLKFYSQQVKIGDIEKYITDRRWKLKPLADRTQIMPQVTFEGSISSLNFVAEIINPRLSLQVWLDAFSPYSIKITPDGYAGDLYYKKDIFPFEIVQKDNKCRFVVYGKFKPEVKYMFQRLVYKTAYCINCEVCEVDCPTGALSITPQVKIDKSKCIHCHKCFVTHDRGCIAADCSRMISDTEKKLNTKVQGYKTFGLREEWIEEYFLNPNEFWKENTLGTAQVDSIKAWLRDAEITDSKNVITPLGKTLQSIYQNNPFMFWGIAYINLSYHSYIVEWVCNNIEIGQVYNKKLIKEEIANQGFSGSLSTVENAASAFIDMAKRSPVGGDLMQGILQGKDGLQRMNYDDLSIEALAYSIYRFAEAHGLNMMRVSDFYQKGEEHGPYVEFRISKDALIKKLRTLTSLPNRVLVAELNMGLEHITLRDDLSSDKVLKIMAL